MAAAPKRLPSPNPIRLLVEAALALRGMSVGKALVFLDMDARKFRGLRAEHGLATLQATVDARQLFGFSAEETCLFYCDLVAAAIRHQPRSLADLPDLWLRLEVALRRTLGDATLEKNLQAAQRGPRPLLPPSRATLAAESARQEVEMLPSAWVARKLQIPETPPMSSAAKSLALVWIAEEIAAAEALEARVERMAAKLAGK